MRFQIKAGRALDEDIVVTVDFDPVEKPKPFQYRKVMMAIAVVTVLGGVLAATAYGAVSGDYGPLRGMAEAGQQLLVKAVSTLIASK